MNTLYILVGLPGSGKTTFAKCAEARDLFCVSIDDCAKELRRYNSRVEDRIIDEMAFAILDKELGAHDVIFDACCNTDDYRIFMEKHLKNPHRTVPIVFAVSPAECINRVHKRNENTDHFYSDASFNLRVNEFEIPQRDIYKAIYVVRNVSDMMYVVKRMAEGRL